MDIDSWLYWFLTREPNTKLAYVLVAAAGVLLGCILLYAVISVFLQ